MLRKRVIPCLLLKDGGLVKTVGFRDETYIGDPVNSIRIYNELGVDELVFLDIRASRENREPPFKLIEEIASECFMPFAYGGGLRTLEQARRIFGIGVEKIVLNSVIIDDPDFIRELVSIYGSQAIVAAIDVKKSMWGGRAAYTHGATKKIRSPLPEYARWLEMLGVGEILLNSISHDGRMQGFDLDCIKEISGAVDVPVIALGGAGGLADIGKASRAGASAIGLGSMAVYQNNNKGILINFPTEKALSAILEERE